MPPRRPTERVERRQKFGSSSYSGPPIPRFNPTQDDWLKIENAYGVSLNEDQRAKLCAIVDEFLIWHRLEQEKLLTEDLIGRIQNIQNAAKCLEILLLPRKRTKLIERAEIEIENGWRGARYAALKEARKQEALVSMTLKAPTDDDNAAPLPALNDILPTLYQPLLNLIRGTKFALDDVRRNSSRSRSGNPWNRLFIGIFELARDERLPTKNSADGTSAPTRFVWEILQRLPPEMPVRFSTQGSLAKAINDATSHLRAIRERTAP